MAQSALLQRSSAALDSGLRLLPASLRNLSSLAAPQLPLLPPQTYSRRSSSSSPLTPLALFNSKKATTNKLSKPPKTKVEDGIFGTSGGIGFTKANELFVGRVAMVGFAASLLGEVITGKGILAQFDRETGLPLNETEPLLVFFILFTLLGAIGALGDRGKFVDDAPAPTGVDRAVIPPGKGVKAALGLNQEGRTFGFTKANELFVGRMAQLGIVFSIIGELITGKGALAQLNVETGVPITEIEPLVGFWILFFLIAAINPGSGKFIVAEDDDE